MARFARDWQVLFFEDPMADAAEPWLEIRHEEGMQVLVPHLPPDCRGPAASAALRRLLDGHLAVQPPQRLIERSPDQYDWSGFLPMLRAAQERGQQVIWDICHYGWPDDLDLWRPAFVERFAGALARLLRNEGIDAPFYSPVNEISYWA
ncbi:hypothetical protein GCM10017624_35870 [Azotobacter vinelandii]|nr:hypothetical protein GCM10017624_35870 [Azotobacter vinelandii]SFY07711.1 hypothetical protein SAMN04244547_03875 [Azotobacter vinelandii]